MMMKKVQADKIKPFAVAAITLLLCFQSVSAQRKIQQIDEEKKEQDERAKAYESSSFWDNVRFGGSVGGYFGSGRGSSSSMFFVQPFAGYLFNDNFIAGPGVTYLYWSRELNYGTFSETYSDHAFGFNLFARHRIFSGLFAHVEYNPMNFTTFNGLGDSKRIWDHALYLGGGYQDDFGGGNFGAYIMVLYNVLYKSDPQVYAPGTFSKNFRASPLDIRIGFMF